MYSKEIMVGECLYMFLFHWVRVCASLLLALRAGMGGQSLVRNNRFFLLFGLQHKLPEGVVMTWWFDVNSKNPKEEHNLCFNVFLNNPGTGGGISLSSGASASCCADILH